MNKYKINIGMRIGFDAKRAFHNRSGLGNYSRDTISILSTFYPENEYFLFTPSLKSPVKFQVKKNVTLVTPEKLLHKTFKSYWRSFGLAKHAEKKSIQIYHGLSNELPYDINKTKIKTLVTIHDLIFLRYPELYKPVDRKIYEKKFRYGCEITDRVIATSNQTKEDIVNFLGIDAKKVEVVYQSCNPKFYESAADVLKHEVKTKYTLPSEFILYVGTIEERKNLLSIVKAMYECKINMPLVVIGKATPYLQQVKQYITEKQLDNKVKFLHFIPSEDLPVIYQAAKLFIYPSVFEGFGIPILEALFSRTPVITSKGGCFSEIGGKKTRYIDPANTEEIGSAIKQILTDTGLQSAMRQEGFEYAQRFKDDMVAGNLMRVYKSVL